MLLISGCSKSAGVTNADIKEVSQKSIDKLVSQLQTGAWNFKFPKDIVYFRQRSFWMKDSLTYAAIYEVWNYKEEKLPECYVEYTLVDNQWELNSIFIDGEN